MTPLLVYLAAVNAAVFLLFGWDKWSAIRRRRRIPEAWLLGPSAVGGCVGAWIASAMFRHKTVKTSFRVKLFLATAVSALLLWAWWRYVHDGDQETPFIQF